RIGIPDDYDDTILEKLMVEFARRHPEVEIFAHSGCTSKFTEAVKTGKLDIAVCSGRSMSEGQPLSSIPNVWAAAQTLELEPSAPVPLAILERTCWWRDIPTTALDEARRSWTLAYSSESFASVRAAIRSGLAVGVVPRNTLEPSMKIMGKREGFPPLPASQRAILVNANAPDELTSAMSDAIVAAVG
ncbi:MAG: LysR substrate-binding domain-containing protein, partial [Pseudomonadota bacterium]